MAPVQAQVPKAPRPAPARRQPRTQACGFLRAVAAARPGTSTRPLLRCVAVAAVMVATWLVAVGLPAGRLTSVMLLASPSSRRLSGALHVPAGAQCSYPASRARACTPMPCWCLPPSLSPARCSRCGHRHHHQHQQHQHQRRRPSDADLGRQAFDDLRPQQRPAPATPEWTNRGEVMPILW